MRKITAFTAGLEIKPYKQSTTAEYLQLCLIVFCVHQHKIVSNDCFHLQSDGLSSYSTIDKVLALLPSRFSCK